MTITYRNVSIKEFICDYAKFTLLNPIPESWTYIYKLPKDKRAIYLYYEDYNIDGDCNEHEVGFIILGLEEYLEDNDALIKEFCIAHLDRIIHANPDDR